MNRRAGQFVTGVGTFIIGKLADSAWDSLAPTLLHWLKHLL